MKVYSAKPYMLVGLVLWVCMYNSGIHATLAGVILAFFLPARSDVRLSKLGNWLDARARELDDTYDDESHVLGQHDFTTAAVRVERVMHHVTPPLERMENYISVPVNFVILPIFAFVNAQVRIVDMDLATIIADPVTKGVYFGAVLGKPIGIILVTWLLVRIGFAKLPKHVDWPQIIAVGIMGGLGFTMSILISGLAFPDPSRGHGGKVRHPRRLRHLSHPGSALRARCERREGTARIPRARPRYGRRVVAAGERRRSSAPSPLTPA